MLVGPEEKKFGIHKGLLCAHSSFFRAALEGSFKEARTGIVTLSEDDPVTFEVFKTWLYPMRLVTERNGQEGPCSDHRLCRLYVLGDVYGVLHLKNAVINALHGGKRTLCYHVSYIYSNTSELSPLRKYVVDRFCWSLQKKFDTQPGNAFDSTWAKDFPQEFLVDLLIAKDKLPKTLDYHDAPFRKDICGAYHEHLAGEEKCVNVAF